MDKFTSIDKLSKKAKKKYYLGKRNTWNGINPTTKIIPSKKTYTRKGNKSVIQNETED